LKHIKDIPDFDRPREKLAAKGPEALSDFKATIDPALFGEPKGT